MRGARRQLMTGILGKPKEDMRKRKREMRVRSWKGEKKERGLNGLTCGYS